MWIQAAHWCMYGHTLHCWSDTDPHLRRVIVDSKEIIDYKHVPIHCTPAILVVVHSDRPGVVCLQSITLLSDPLQSTLSRNTGPVEILNLVLASLKASAPVIGKPSCLHTTVASLVLNPSLHTEPQALFMQPWTAPRVALAPPISRSSPSVQLLKTVIDLSAVWQLGVSSLLSIAYWALAYPDTLLQLLQAHHK